MEEKDSSTYQISVGKRLLEIMTKLGLERSGFAEFTQISASHLYALINGNRKITDEIATKIAGMVNLSLAEFFNLDFAIPDAIAEIPLIRKFRKEHKDNPEYFSDTNRSRVKAYALDKLIAAKTFAEPGADISQIAYGFKTVGLDMDSKEASKYMEYQASTNEFIRKMVPTIKKNGEPGVRKKAVYILNKKDTSDA